MIGRFEEALSLEARDSGVDGIICGHIHHADMHNRLGVHYINTGDWVESCTAVAEEYDGQFELITWTEMAPRPPRAPRVPGQRRLRLRRARAT